MTRLLPVAAAVIVLLFSGMVHGLWTDRWVESRDLAEAAARLKQLPLKLGDWVGEDVSSRSRPSSGIAGTMSRHYVHRPTGRTVTMFINCGRPGPVSIHTPDVCYTACGYKELRKESYTLSAKSAAAGASFNTGLYRRDKAGDQKQLRIFWAWSSGDSWEIADDPRLAFAHRPILYKLYVMRETGMGPQPVEGDPCLELMEKLLPALQRDVLPRS